jgi:hypothetical protein
LRLRGLVGRSSAVHVRRPGDSDSTGCRLGLRSPAGDSEPRARPGADWDSNLRLGFHWPGDSARTRAGGAGELGYRSAAVAVSTFRGWYVRARCHRHKKNLRETPRSGSELVSLALSDRILLLIACRPRARVKRACAVGVARPGARIGRPVLSRGILQSWWALVLTPTWTQMSPRATVPGPGYRQSLRPRGPAPRNGPGPGTGHLPLANRAG